MSGAKLKTVGVAPKTGAAAVAALAAPLLARALGDALGVEVDSETVEGLVLAGIAAVSAFAAAYWAPPGQVVVERSTPSREAGDMMMGAGKQDGNIDILTVGAILGIAAFVLVLVILL